MRLEDIQIRDPFVLHVPDRADGPDDADGPGPGRYHLFGSTDADIWSGPATGFDTYWSDDLEHWHGPTAAFRPAPDFWSHTQYWAPEVHRHGDAFYMFATFTAEGERRGTQVLRAERPEGPYEPWSDGPLTPRGWECLDGTLHLEGDGTPYLVFCHEWKDVGDGEVQAVRLADDLRTTIGEPFLLFRASEAPWARSIPRPEFPEVYVTDGPSMHRTRDGRLTMLWSSFGDSGYAMGVATSASGGIAGPWTQADEPIWPADGGHGMIFADASGELFLTLHTPNRTPDERARLVPLEETPDGLRLRR